MKKANILALLLALVLLLLLAACGQTAEQSGSAASDSAAEDVAQETGAEPQEAAPEVKESAVEPQEPIAVPALSVTSTIFGSGDTGGKTTLKNILLTAAGSGAFSAATETAATSLIWRSAGSPMTDSLSMPRNFR